MKELSILPERIDMIKYIRSIPEQGSIGSCAAQATLSAIEIVMEKYNKYTYFSRLFIYFMARKLQGRPGENGTRLVYILQALKQYGVPPDQLWPYRYTLQNTRPCKLAIDTALLYRLIDYTSISIDIPSIKNRIINGQPVIIGLATGKKFWKIAGPLDRQIYYLINDIDNVFSKDHAVVIVGYDDTLSAGSFIIANSSGLSWGSSGIGILPYQCINDINEAYVINHFNEISVDKNLYRIDK